MKKYYLGSPTAQSVEDTIQCIAYLCSPNDSGGRILLLLEIISKVQITSHQNTWVQKNFN